MIKVAGVVVLYHPTGLANIHSYLDEVDILLLIDNSEPNLQSTLLDQFSKDERQKIQLISNSQNFGVAKALNQAAFFAIENEYAWLLTMDQDSFFEKGSLPLMKHFASAAKPKPGIITPFHRTPQSPQARFNQNYSSVRMTMTSGNLLNLDAFAKCGPFEEKLFIDSVDHEYCLRLRKKGYQLIRVNAATLYHALGDIAYHRFLFFRFKTTNHSAARRYYIARNRLYVMCKYVGFDFKFFRRELGQYAKDFLRVVFLEKGKTKKLGAILKGTAHFLKGQFGPL